MLTKIDPGKDEMDKIGKKDWKKRRGREGNDDIEDVIRETKAVEKRALVVAENEMERMDCRILLKMRTRLVKSSSKQRRKRRRLTKTRKEK